ncbi:hypothetical protein PMAYCL1PPCAC_15225, partial [Pristionchus mayeri]
QVELVKRWGYPVEKHDVITKDGYILDLTRIPRGREDNRNISRPVILLVHGLFASGTQWLLNPPDLSAGFIYADAGLDVFIANMRGTTYGRRHLKMDPDTDNDFWKFSFDEMARYDLPAIIDNTLNVSCEDQLYLMGHSQGTLVAFLLLSNKPRYNSKIKKLFLMSPIATGHYIRGLAQLGVSFYFAFWPVTEAWRLRMGSQEILNHNHWVNKLIIAAGTTLCAPPVHEACYDALYLIAGPPNFKHMNASRMDVYLSNFPAGTSTRNILHWGQITSREMVSRFDYNNPIENNYGKLRPPVYNYSEIDVPMYTYWSRNDWLTTPVDIQKDFYPKLRKGIVKRAVEIPEFNHLDFAFSTTAAERVYIPVLNIIKEDME